MIAADHFLMDHLKDEAVTIVRSMIDVDDLWPILDDVCGTGLEHLVVGCFEVRTVLELKFTRKILKQLCGGICYRTL